MEELKRLREEKGWSQTRLAQESGVDRATINQVEGGRRSPTISTLELLATALGAEVADFFPKAQASLPLEVPRGEDEGSVQDAPRYTAFEAFGRALAFAWGDDLKEWDAKIPDGKWPDSMDFARLAQWVIEIAGTEAVYRAIAQDLGTPPRAELADTLQLLGEAHSAAIRKALRAYEPAKTFKEFQKIWEASDMNAVVNEAGRR